MFKRLIKWLKEFYGIGVQPEEPLPEDVWDLLFVLSEQVSAKKFAGLDITHFDIIVHTYSPHIKDLCKRLEMMIKCIKTDQTAPLWWEERDAMKLYDCLPDFLFEDVVGYWTPAKTASVLTEKVIVIHDLIEQLSINPKHSYYFYMRKEFYQIVSDAVEILTRLNQIGTDK
jgi:hypothetical protein